MRPKLLFIVLSAVAKPGTVEQLARSLAPHEVLIHRDFTQSPRFELTAPNARFIPDPKRTGWDSFGFVEGVCYSLRYALDNASFDYVQLLSETCLPIKPLAEFEAYVRSQEGTDAHFDCIDVFNDQDAWKGLAYRMLLDKESMAHRLMRRMTDVYNRRASHRREEAGIWLRSGGGKGLGAYLAGRMIDTLRWPAVGRHFPDRSFRPYYGAPWIGARPWVVRGVLEGFSTPGVRGHFSRLQIADEFLIPTLVMRLGASLGPMNHHINLYDEARTRIFTRADFDSLQASPKYFARKFPDDADAPIRTRVLRELVGQEVSGIRQSHLLLGNTRP